MEGKTKRGAVMLRFDVIENSVKEQMMLARKYYTNGQYDSLDVPFYQLIGMRRVLRYGFDLGTVHGDLAFELCEQITKCIDEVTAEKPDDDGLTDADINGGGESL
jgi:hypothetical protein